MPWDKIKKSPQLPDPAVTRVWLVASKIRQFHLSAPSHRLW